VITAALAFTLLAQVGPEVPVAPPLANNSPQYEFGVRLAATRDRFLLTYGSYTTLVVEAVDARSGEMLTQSRARLNLFGNDLVASGDGFLYLTFGSNALEVTPLDDRGEPRAATQSIIPGIWGAIGAIGSDALVVGTGDAMLIDRDLLPIRSVPLPVHGDLKEPPAVAAARDRYLVARADADGLFATIVTARGDVVATTSRLGEGQGGLAIRPAAASDGSSFLAVWRDGNDLRAATVAADGTAGQPFSVASVDNFATYSATWTGDAWLVAYNAKSDLYAQRVARDGALLGAPFLVEDNGRPKGDFGIAWNGDRTFVAWAEGYACNAGSDVYGRFLEAGQAPMLLSPGVADQTRPALTANALAWSERSDVNHVRVTAGGTTRTAPSAGVATQDSAALASDGADVLVAWQETRTDGCRSVLVVATLSRFDRSNVIGSDPDPNAVPSIAFNGVDYAILWADKSSRLYVSRVARDGTPRGAPLAITAPETPMMYANFYSITPGIVWTGSDYVVVRERFLLYVVPLHSPPPIFDVRMQRLAADFSPVGAEAVIATGTTPAVAWSGSETFIVWREATLLRGRVGEGAPQTLAEAPAGGAPSVTWTGTDYVVTAGPLLIRVLRDGRVAGTMLLADDAGRSMAANTPAGLLIAYERPLPPESHRIVTRLGAPARRRAAAR
jgi:hypothetical protein